MRYTLDNQPNNKDSLSVKVNNTEKIDVFRILVCCQFPQLCKNRQCEWV